MDVVLEQNRMLKCNRFWNSCPVMQNCEMRLRVFSGLAQQSFKNFSLYCQNMFCYIFLGKLCTCMTPDVQGVLRPALPSIQKGTV